MSLGIGAGATRRAHGRLAQGLLLGGSAATLMAACAGQALADVTVNGGSTPVATATAASSGADNIVQTGTLNVPSGTAITLNSNNSVTNSGTVQTQNASNLTGILAIGGNAGSISNAGAITFNQTDTLTTTDSNGVVTGPFATQTNIYGIRVIGPGSLAGDVGMGGTITVQGSNSYGISVETGLTGSIVSTGTLSVSGDNSVGLRTTGPVGGNVTVTGPVTVGGAGAQAINLGGEISGQLVLGATITATGYHNTVRSTTDSIIAKENTDDDVQGGAAVTVGGSVDKGILITAPPTTLSSTDADVNGDGIADSGETTAVITSYGGAPAMVIGGSNPITVGGAVGTGDSAYGLVIGGTIQGLGLRDGVAANGLEIGQPGGGTVSIPNGIHVMGAVTAASYTADATAMHLYSGASVGQLNNTTNIVATMNGESQNAANAIVVESGASMPTILNGGTISAVVAGSNGTAAAIVDRAGSLTRLENTGKIEALISPPTATGAQVTGTGVAIDDSANTTGLNLLNYQSTGVSTVPTITGSIKLGSGNDNLDIEAGTVAGDITLGAGANSLTINGGASVTGALTADGGTLALSVGDGSLQINSASHLKLTSLNLGSASKVTLTADPAAGVATQFDVAGAANIADGAKLALRVVSLVNGTQTFTLVHASQLNAGAVDTSLLTTTPYIYSASVATDPTAGTISLTLGRKTGAELGLPGTVTGAFDTVVSSIQGNSALSQALLVPTTKEAFGAAYNQLLPEHSGAVFQMIRAGVEAFGRPIDDRQSPDGGGVWVQEINVGAYGSDQDGLPGYKGWGVGLIAGFEAPATPVGVFGLTIGGMSGEINPNDADANDEIIANTVELGGYWRATLGRFALNARVGADHLTATDHRVVTVTSEGENVFNQTATGHWGGWGLTSRFRASYEARWNAIYVRPQLGVDYFRLSEDAYNEGGGAAIDLAVDQRTTSEFSGFAGVALGAAFGQDGATWGPEVLLGYRDVINHGDGLTTARFLTGGDSFTVGENPLGGGGEVVRLAFKSESTWGAVALEGGAEVRDNLTIYDAKLAVHFKF